MAEGPRVHHVGLTVTDVDASAAWYQALLGPADAVRREGPDWHRIRLVWPNGFLLSLTRHDGTAAHDRFDHTRVGLDHLSLACGSEDEVREVAARLDELGVERGPVEDAPYAWTVTARDPDGTPIEFFCPRG